MFGAVVEVRVLGLVDLFDLEGAAGHAHEALDGEHLLPPGLVHLLTGELALQVENGVHQPVILFVDLFDLVLPFHSDCTQWVLTDVAACQCWGLWSDSPVLR